MKSITQKDSFGCGAACVAFILGVSYKDAINKMGSQAAKSKGYGCQKFCNALTNESIKFRFKKYRPELGSLLTKDDTIVFISRSNSYPSGHYLCRKDGFWMDPWINITSSQKLSEAKSGFRTNLPGKPEFVIFPDPETSMPWRHAVVQDDKEYSSQMRCK